MDYTIKLVWKKNQGVIYWKQGKIVRIKQSIQSFIYDKSYL